MESPEFPSASHSNVNWTLDCNCITLIQSKCLTSCINITWFISEEKYFLPAPLHNVCVTPGLCLYLSIGAQLSSSSNRLQSADPASDKEGASTGTDFNNHTVYPNLLSNFLIPFRLDHHYINVNSPKC